MIHDGWIKMEVLSIVIEWSLVDNLVISKNKEKSAKFFFLIKNPIILIILCNILH